MEPAEARAARAPKRSGRGGAARLLRDLNILFLLVLLAAGAALLLSPRSDDELLGLPELAAGEISPRMVRAPRDFTIEDPETTEGLRREAISRVRPIYDHLTGFGQSKKTKIEHAFEEMTLPAEGERPPRERLEAFMRMLGVYFDDPDLTLLERAGFSDEQRDATIMVIRSIYERQIVADKELLKIQAPQGLVLRTVGPDGSADHEESVFEFSDVLGLDAARAEIDQISAEKLTHLPPEQRRGASLLAKRLLEPNVIENRRETELRAISAGKAVKTVVIPIKRGEVIIPADASVTDRQLMILEGMARASSGGPRFAGPIGSAILVVLLIVSAYQFGRRTKLNYLATHRDLAFGATLCLIVLFWMWGGYKLASWLAGLEGSGVPLVTYRYLLPVAAPALLMRFVMGSRMAATFIPFAALAAGWTMDQSLGFSAYVLTGSLAAASVSPNDRPRVQLFSAGLWAGLAQATMVLALSLLGSAPELTRTLIDLGAGLASGIFSSLAALFMIPLIEVLFGYSTKLKLSLLANLNHPLLRELLVQAPGTYHHSIMVGALAEAGARAIGADPLLAKVGGYYHDVGKIKNPSAFDENRRGGSELPSSIEAGEGAQEIRLHVAEGLALGAKHRLGQPVLEIIAQHHGTRTVRVQDAERRSWPSEGLDRRSLPLPFDETTPVVGPGGLAYPGPKPLGAEAGLVLLADAVEAATSREIAHQALEEGQLESTIARVVRDVLEEGQLDQCQITLAQVDLASHEFAGVLKEMLTRRGRPSVSVRPAPGDPRVVIPPATRKDQPN